LKVELSNENKRKIKVNTFLTFTNNFNCSKIALSKVNSFGDLI